MKKKGIVIACAMVLAIGSMAFTMTCIEASARRVDYVGYVAETDKPVIDGKIDDVWMDAGTLSTSQGYASVLWNETGIYYLAYVYDNSITSKDSCTFWICEDYYLNNAWLEYFSGGGGYDEDGKSGAYFVNATANGIITASCTGSDKYQDIQGAVAQERGYWVAELFVPQMGEKTRLADNERIGFEFTIDSYDSEQDTRASRSKWMSNHNWPHETDHTALGKLVLSKSNEEETSVQVISEDVIAPETAPNNIKPVSAKSNENVANGCKAVASSSALVGICALALYFKKRK